MFINKTILVIIACVIALLCGIVVYLNYKSYNETARYIETVQRDDITMQFYYEREFNALKKENKELYDSLKKQKKDIESLSQFQYKVKYKTDTVFITSEEPLPEVLKELPDKTYTYNSETDTLSYKLEINSKLEPSWYTLTTEVKDKFTIVNKDYGNGQQVTSIESANKGDISDVTSWQKPKSKKWYQNFSFGPTVSVGYDPVNKNVGVVVGVGLTYNIFGN